MAGLGLFAIFFAVTLSRLWRSRDPRAPWLAAAGLALGFFVLSTHMHENHLFPFLPLVAALGLGDRRLRGVYLVVSATFLANMALHDPYLGHALRDRGFGPGVVLRPPAELSPATARFLEASGYAYLIDEATRPASLGWIVLTLLNSLANVAAFVWWSFAFYRGRNFDAALAAAPPPSTVEARGFARLAVP